MQSREENSVLVCMLAYSIKRKLEQALTKDGNMNNYEFQWLHASLKSYSSTVDWYVLHVMGSP